MKFSWKLFKIKTVTKKHIKMVTLLSLKSELKTSIIFQQWKKHNHEKQVSALADPGHSWHPTFGLRWHTNHMLSILDITPCTGSGTGLPSSFLRAEPWERFWNLIKCCNRFFPNNKTKVRDYSTFNAKSFIDDLQNINWNNICKHIDANQSFSSF